MFSSGPGSLKAHFLKDQTPSAGWGHFHGLPHSSSGDILPSAWPEELSYPETGARPEWSLVIPAPAGECEASVISFPQLLLRNSRPATGPRTSLKITSGFQTESPKSCLSGGFAGARVGPEGLCRSR